VPAYLEVTRTGSTFTASTSTSADGVTWTVIPGSAFTLVVGASLLAGLAVTSLHVGVLGAVSLDSFSMG